MPRLEKQPLKLRELTAITILDGRNRSDVVELAPHVSEFGVIRTRVEIEAKYLMALSDVGIVRPLTPPERRRLGSFGERISLPDAQKIKKIEDETQHDVKAMERAFRTMMQETSLEDLIEMVHIGLTSEDVNNLTYRLILKRATDGVLVPALDKVTDELVSRSSDYKATPMLARTHGQAAIPTTLGKEMVVFAKRLNKEVRELSDRPLAGKLTGAVGNLNALQFTYPQVDWIAFSENFVQSFGFEANLATTQIDPYEDMIAYFQNYARINGVLTDFDQDMWRYISDYWFAQEKKKGEVGSSTMPQKINPIRFENSEGNLGKATALFEYFARKLSVSRLQRDLSDSTVIRDMGAPLGWSLLAYKNTLRGLQRVKPNFDVIHDALYADWSILGEAAQTLMRSLGIEDPYSLMADLTRGQHLSRRDWIYMVEKLPLDKENKKRLRNLTPGKYIGRAVELTERTIDEIKSSRGLAKKN